MADLGVEETLYRQETSGSLNAGALTFTTNFSREVAVSFVGIHSTVDFAANDIIEIYFDSVTGANYDFLLASEDMKDKFDFVWYPDGQLFLKAGDELRIVVPQLASATAYITSIARQA